MTPKPEVWGIIPTRGGSSGLAEKNIRHIAGMPMIHYMIGEALRAASVTKLFVTTDNDDIERVAREIEGVSIYRHDPDLSLPGKPTFGAFRYAYESICRDFDTSPAAVALLRCTTPLCRSEDIDAAINLFFDRRVRPSGVLSVVRSDFHPKRVYRIEDDGVLVHREPTPESDYPLPRQVFDDVYIRNGAIYVTSPSTVLGGSLWGDTPVAYVMPKERSININDEIDFLTAEALLQIRQRKQ